MSTLNFLELGAESKTLQEQIAKQLLENEELGRQKSFTIPKVPVPNMGQSLFFFFFFLLLFPFSDSNIRQCSIWNSFQYYTGFTYEQFRNIFLFLVPCEEFKFELPKTVSSAKTKSHAGSVILRTKSVTKKQINKYMAEK